MKTPVLTRLGALMCLLLPAVAQAQSPIIIGPGSSIAWEIAAPDLATANGLTYAATVDAAAPKVLTPVACVVGAAPLPAGTFTCSTPIAQIPTGSHQLTLTAASGGIVSLPSTPFAYVDMLIPVPQNVRAKP